MKEIVSLAVVIEKGGVRIGGSFSVIFLVRTKGWYSVISKEYVIRVVKEIIRVLRVRIEREKLLV